YILYVIGFIKNIFHPSDAGLYFLLKIPAMICDILCALIIFNLAEKHSEHKTGIVCTALFLFNPAVVLNSSVWGQVDSVFTVFVLLMLCCIFEKRLYPAYFFFAAAIFIKPQALFYTPVLIYAAIELVFYDNFSFSKLLRHIIAGLSAILMIFLLALPFNINSVISQYRNTIGSYNFASVNAYNLWTALGFNWRELNGAVSVIGYSMIILIVIASAFMYFVKKRRNRCFFVSAFICFATFMLSVKMHDRYAYPAMPLMLCAYALSKSKKDAALYLGISVLQFMNAAHVLFYYDPATYFSTSYSQIAIIISIAAVLFFAAMCLLIIKQERIKK
ncbi:MAG: glycosyltransferase 87 family protein, partial [Clostridiales bacterium]|nr:glycosyltransferase 87 family protein [Clostridiales bacterium]